MIQRFHPPLFFQCLSIVFFDSTLHNTNIFPLRTFPFNNPLRPPRNVQIEWRRKKSASIPRKCAYWREFSSYGLDCHCSRHVIFDGNRKKQLLYLFIVLLAMVHYEELHFSFDNHANFWLICEILVCYWFVVVCAKNMPTQCNQFINDKMVLEMSY